MLTIESPVSFEETIRSDPSMFPSAQCQVPSLAWIESHGIGASGVGAGGW